MQHRARSSAAALVVRLSAVCGSAVCLVAVCLAAGAAADPSGPVAEPPAQPWLTEIDKKLSNPVSDLWSIAFQQNHHRVDVGPAIGGRRSSNLNFQPVLPVALTDDWNLITRPVRTLFGSVPHRDPGTLARDVDRSTAFGDTLLLELLSPGPRLAGNGPLGAGPTFFFPPAGSRWTGQGKWQVGSAAIAG